MRLTAIISIGSDGKLHYDGRLEADEALKSDTSVRLQAISTADKAIWEAILETNDILKNNGITAQLADDRYDEYGNYLSFD